MTRHANATTITLSLQQDGENLQVSICDDGIGFEVSPQPTQVSPQGGFGLFNIYERIHSMGGSMLIDSHPGSGTTISLSIKNR